MLKHKEKPDYQIAFEARSDYLYARVKADRLTENVILDFLTDIMMEAANARRRRILIDRDIPAAPAKGGAQHAWNHFLKVVQGQRIAIVNRHPEIMADLKKRLSFLEKSPSAVRLFDELPAARAWLAAGPIPDYNLKKPLFYPRPLSL